MSMKLLVRSVPAIVTSDPSASIVMAVVPSDDLMSLPTRDGRRMISYHFFHDENGKEKVKGMDRSMSAVSYTHLTLPTKRIV